MSEIHCILLVHGKRWQVGGTNYPFQVQLGEIFVSTINQICFWDASLRGDGAGPNVLFQLQTNGKDSNRTDEKQDVQGGKIGLNLVRC